MACAPFTGAALAIGTELEVAVITPVRTPTILDNPVLATLVRVRFAVPHNCNSMVNIVSIRVTAITVMVADDTRAVATKTAKVRVDSCTNRAFSNENSKSIIRDFVFFMRFNIVESLLSLGAWISAVLLAANIIRRVVIPPDYTVDLRKVPCIGHPAALTSPIYFITIH